MNKKIVGVSVLYILVMCSFLSCFNSDSSKNEKAEKNLIVGFSQIGAESAWRKAHTSSVLAAAKKHNIQVLYNNAEQKQENQIKALRSFISYQVDVIILVPIVQDGWENVLTEAKDANIPVLIVDRKITIEDKTLYAGYLGPDNTQEGREAAYYLQRKFADTNETITIFEMRGTDSSSAAVDRFIGFREIVEQDSRFAIIASETGDFLRSLGKEVMHNWLQAHEVPDIIFSHNDGMALGIIEALEENAIGPGRDVIIVSIDAEQDAIENLKDGKLNCVVECNPNIGEDIMQLIIDLSQGKTIFDTMYKPEIIFEEGVDLISIPPRGY